MSTATFLCETIATKSTSKYASSNSDSSVHQRRRPSYPSSIVIMQPHDELVTIERTETPPSGDSSLSKDGADDSVTSLRSSSIQVLLEDEAAEPFQHFLLTSSPMPSLRRVDEDLVVAPLAVDRLRILDRTTSAPMTVPAVEESDEPEGKLQRRSIFGPFWQSSSMRQKERFRMPTRPTSSGMLEASFPHHPSMPHKAMSLRSSPDEYHAAIDTMLPCVPAPLERLLCRSSGVYPLCEPKPILKRDDSESDSASQLEAGLKHTFQSQPSKSSPASEDSATETTCESTTASKAVHFDPRVVVTELNDDCPRSWYSDRDLRKFQAETCTLAKAYLQMHPELIPLYSKPIYDPILKKTRRKPLFGLQGLCKTDLCLANLQVKRILLVDPNEKILNLLCRSLQMIFPAAEMVRCSSGPTALETLKKCDIDIVVCQEHLAPRHCTHGELDTSASLFARYQQEDADKWQNTLLISVTPEMEAVGERSIAGHGPTDLVWGLPPPKMDMALQQRLVAALNEKKGHDENGCDQR